MEDIDCHERRLQHTPSSGVGRKTPNKQNTPSDHELGTLWVFKGYKKSSVDIRREDTYHLPIFHRRTLLADCVEI